MSVANQKLLNNARLTRFWSILEKFPPRIAREVVETIANTMGNNEKCFTSDRRELWNRLRGGDRALRDSPEYEVLSPEWWDAIFTYGSNDLLFQEIVRQWMHHYEHVDY